MTFEEFEKKKEEIGRCMVLISEAELARVQADSSFAVDEFDTEFCKVRRLLEWYQEELERSVPKEKVLCCPVCKGKVAVDEEKCSRCGQVLGVGD